MRSFICALLLVLPTVSAWVARQPRALRSLAIKMSAEERTFIMVKPDGVERGLAGTILTRFGKMLRAAPQASCTLKPELEHPR